MIDATASVLRGAERLVRGTPQIACWGQKARSKPTVSASMSKASAMVSRRLNALPGGRVPHEGETSARSLLSAQGAGGHRSSKGGAGQSKASAQKALRIRERGLRSLL